MGKKMKFPFLSKNNSVKAKKSSSWPWPSCHQPRTLSFKAGDGLFKTINSAYLDAIIESAETPQSHWFSNSSEPPSFSTASDDDDFGGDGDPVETVIKGLRSERLFFKPGKTSSILEEAKPGDGLFPFKESVALSMESLDPHVDFRKSMEEMVEANGLKDWEDLEELLSWYLRANVESNHGYIVGAFVDLIVGLAISSTNTNFIPSCSSCSHSHSSALSFYTSSSSSTSSSEDNSSTTTPCVSSLEAEGEIDNNHCLSSLSEADQKEISSKIHNKDDVSSSLLQV